MGDLSLLMIVIACGVFVIVIYFQCCACVRDQRQIRQLTAPVFPDIIIQRDENQNRMPITNGIRVERITEDLEIILAD